MIWWVTSGSCVAPLPAAAAAGSWPFGPSFEPTFRLCAPASAGAFFVCAAASFFCLLCFFFSVAAFFFSRLVLPEEDPGAPSPSSLLLSLLPSHPPPPHTRQRPMRMECRAEWQGGCLVVLLSLVHLSLQRPQYHPCCD